MLYSNAKNYTVFWKSMYSLWQYYWHASLSAKKEGWKNSHRILRMLHFAQLSLDEGGLTPRSSHIFRQTNFQDTQMPIWGHQCASQAWSSTTEHSCKDEENMFTPNWKTTGPASNPSTFLLLAGRANKDTIVSPHFYNSFCISILIVVSSI